MSVLSPAVDYEDVWRDVQYISFVVKEDSKIDFLATGMGHVCHVRVAGRVIMDNVIGSIQPRTLRLVASGGAKRQVRYTIQLGIGGDDVGSFGGRASINTTKSAKWKIEV